MPAWFVQATWSFVAAALLKIQCALCQINISCGESRHRLQSPLGVNVCGAESAAHRLPVAAHCPATFPSGAPCTLYFALSWSEPRAGAGHGRAQSLLCDSGYRGQALCAGRAGDCGWARRRYRLPREANCSTFKVMPKRWIVERSFAGLEKNRRLAWKNCERWLNTSLQFVHLAFLGLLLRRL